MEKEHIDLDSEGEPPYHMPLGLQNYGGTILTTDNTDISQLSALHVGLLLVACTGAIILLLINCVGLLCCTRYLTRPEPDTLLDASFRTTDSGRIKWRYKSPSYQQHNVNMFPQTSFDDDSTCGEQIKLQRFPSRDHGAITKSPITSDQAICKNCNIWL